MVKHIKIKVIGLVQGVWFRKSTMEEAMRLGITGFVKNETDNSVYIEAEGAEEQLQQLLIWCRRGPRLARVDNLETTDGVVQGFIDFKIR